MLQTEWNFSRTFLLLLPPQSLKHHSAFPTTTREKQQLYDRLCLFIRGWIEEKPKSCFVCRINKAKKTSEKPSWVPKRISFINIKFQKHLDCRKQLDSLTLSCFWVILFIMQDSLWRWNFISLFVIEFSRILNSQKGRVCLSAIYYLWLKILDWVTVWFMTSDKLGHFENFFHLHLEFSATHTLVITRIFSWYRKSFLIV